MNKQECMDQIKGLLDLLVPDPAPVGITPEQEAADIEAAVKPLRDQVAALQLAKADEDAVLASLEDVITKIKALVQ